MKPEISHISRFPAASGDALLRVGRVAGGVACAFVLAACGGGGGGDSTQVAAKVNKSEVSVHQVNHYLSRQPGIRPEMVPAASKRILEGLIDQELAIQQATEQKLDRDPKVVQSIEAARRDIIARAYADRVAESASKPTPEEVQQYYASKPALFAQRRVYLMHEFNIAAPAEQRAALAQKLGAAKSADEIVGALKAADFKFSQRSVTQGPESLPMAMVDKVGVMAEGQSISAVTPNGLMLMFVSAARPAPVTEAAARPAIEQFLINDRKRKLVADEVKRLRAAAAIEYKGQFAEASAAAASGVEAPAVAPTQAASQ